MKHIQIFKTGTHTPMKGAAIAFTEQDMRAAVAAYDRAVSEAPLVVGHPADNGPAYGWVKSLAFAEGVLLASPDQVDPAFAELVNNGRFKKISAAFYTPDSPSNPKPGTYYLRHVGFLGAQPPAIKGLKDASFAANEEGIVEFSDWGPSSSGVGMFRRLREFMIEQFGVAKADAVLPDWEITALQDEAGRAKEPPAAIEQKVEVPPPNQENEEMKKTPEEQAEELKRREDALARSEAAFAERATAARHSDIAAFATGLVKAGKVLPKDQDGLVAFMASLPADNVVQFGEGTAKQSIPGDQFIRSFLSGLPQQVEFKEVAQDDGTVKQDGAKASDIAARAVEFQEAEHKAGRHISVTAAVQHVTKGDSK